MFPIAPERVGLCTMTVESIKFRDGDAVLALAVNAQAILLDELIPLQTLVNSQTELLNSLAF